MRGLPTTLNTKQDWLNAFEYAKKTRNPEIKAELRKRLQALRETKDMLILKPGVKKNSEDLTPNDFEKAEDPASPLARSGLKENKINQLISELS